MLRTPPKEPARTLASNLAQKLLLALAPIAAVFSISFVSLFFLGYIKPFAVPTGGMAPAISSGDHVFMERVSFAKHPPRRGDIIVFRTAGIISLPQNQVYVKRVAGIPGEHVRISNGKLYLNDRQINITGGTAEPDYRLPGPWQQSANTDLVVPERSYYVLGDNGTNSFDSRSYGCIPAENVMGRVCVCYWPPARIGRVK